MPALASRRAILALLLCVSMRLPAAGEARDWSVQITPFDEVFPALDLSQTPRDVASDAGAPVLGSGSGLVAVSVTAQRDRERVQLEVAAPEWLSTPARLEVTLPRRGEHYELRPPLAWRAARLAALTGPHATQLDFSLRRDAGVAQHVERAISLRPLNEALYFVRDGSDSVDLSWIFAAFVNEGDAAVDRVLALAADSGIVDHFDGYAGADADDVLREVWAVWHALSAHGIHYSGADPGVDRGPRVFSQRVRFLADTWNDRSANCIDGSALIASALQRIGLRSFLVLVPGHALVGVYTDAESRHAVYVETTLLGAQVGAAASLPRYAQAIDTSAATRASLASFDAALRAGAARHAQVAGKLDGRHRPDYAIIDIAAARSFGIQPIPTPDLSGNAATTTTR